VFLTKRQHQLKKKIDLRWEKWSTACLVKCKQDVLATMKVDIFMLEHMRRIDYCRFQGLSFQTIWRNDLDNPLTEESAWKSLVNAAVRRRELYLIHSKYRKEQKLNAISGKGRKQASDRSRGPAINPGGF